MGFLFYEDELSIKCERNFLLRRKDNEKTINKEPCVFRTIYRFWLGASIPDRTDPKPGQQIFAYASACFDSRLCMWLALWLNNRFYCADIQKLAVRDAAYVSNCRRHGC